MKKLILGIVAGIAAVGGAETVGEPARDLPLIEDVDVAVVGGGFAAASAALAAKEAGANVFVVMPRQNPGDDIASTRRLWLDARDEIATGGLADTVFPPASGVDFSYSPSVAAVDPHADASHTILMDGVFNDASNNSAQYGTKDAPCASVTFTVSPEQSGGAILSVRLFYYVGDSSDYGKYSTSGITVSVGEDAVAGTLSAADGSGYKSWLFTPSEPIAAGTELTVVATTADGCVRQLIGELQLASQSASRSKATSPAAVFKAIDAALIAAGIPYFTGAQACDVLRDGAGRVSGVVVANRSGRQAVKAKAVVDATEWGSVARKVAELRTGPSETAFTHVTTISADVQPVWPEGYSAVEVKSRLLTVSVTPSDLKPSGAPANYPAKTYAVTKAFPLASSDYMGVSAIAQQMRGELWQASVADQSEKPFFVPPESVASANGAQVAGWTDAASAPIDAFRAASASDLWVAGMLADFDRAAAERLSLPGVAEQIGRRVGAAAAAAALERGAVGEVTCGASGAEAADVREPNGRPLHVGRASGTVAYAGGELPVIADADVVVVGGGTAGGPAAIAASGEGKSVVVLEWLFGMGGTTTESRIGRYWYGNVRGFTKNAVDAGTKGANAIGWVFHETKSEWFRRTASANGAQIVFGAFAEGALVDGTDAEGRARVRGVVAVLPDGTRGVVKAKAVVDATGNADVAAAAGAETMFLSPEEFAMQGSAASPHTPGESYKNTDVGFLNTPDAGDLFTFALRARLGLPTTAWNLSHVNVGARERRRIVGDYVVTAADELIGRRYPDTVMHGRSNFDMHGFTTSPLMMYCNHTKDQTFSADLPYRALIPRGLDGIYSTGLSVSADRDAMPILRMQPDVQNQGYAVGLAAAAACDAGSVRAVDVKALQTRLVADGCLDSRVLTDVETTYDAAAAQSAVESLDVDFLTLPYIVSFPSETLPLLRDAFASAEVGSDHRKAVACALMLLGDDTGFDVVADAFAVSDVTKGSNFRGLGNFGRQTSGFDLLLFSLSRSRSPKAAAAIARRMPDMLRDKGDGSTEILPMSHFRMGALAAASLRSHRVAGQFATLIARNGNLAGWKRTEIEKVTYSGENDMDTERMRIIRDLAILGARRRFGDAEAEAGLRAYLDDYRTIYASWAALSLALPQLPADLGTWTGPDTLTIDLGTPDAPNRVSGLVSVSDATVRLVGSAVSDGDVVDYALIKDGSFEPTNGTDLSTPADIGSRDKRGSDATKLFSGSWNFANNAAGIAADGSYFMKVGNPVSVAMLEGGGKHSGFLARKTDGSTGSMSNKVTVEEAGDYRLSFYTGSRTYDSTFNMQVITKLDGTDVDTYPETAGKVTHWTLHEIALNNLSAGEHTITLAAPSDKGELWMMLDLVKFGKVSHLTGNDDFGDAFKRLRFDLSDDAKLELALDGVQPVRVGGLKVNGAAVRGIVDSSAAYAEGTGEINVLPVQSAALIR